jgi:hypothetical protein
VRVVAPWVADIPGIAQLVAMDPPAALVLRALSSLTTAAAPAVFAYLSGAHTRIFQQAADRAQLVRLAMVPVAVLEGGQEVRLPASQCFFRGDGEAEGLWGRLLPFVDFGARARPFLEACGVRGAPTLVDVVAEVARRPADVLEVLGAENYLDVMRQVAAASSQQPALLRALRDRPVLLVIPAAGSSKAPMLVRPSDCTIADDTTLQDLLGTWSCPHDEALQRLYLSLGCRPLSAEVEEQVVVQELAPVGATAALAIAGGDAAQLQRRIKERSAALVHQRGGPRQPQGRSPCHALPAHLCRFTSRSGRA